MCPNMHFGILIRIDVQYEKAKIHRVLDMLAKAHPFLRSLIAYEQDGTTLYYAVGENSRIETLERENSATIWNAYEEIGKKDWNIFENGLLKVLIYPEEKSFQVLFIAHHLLGDGRTILGLATEFADAYVKGIKPGYVEERLIKTIEDLPGGSDLTGISKWLVLRANQQWKRENRKVTYELYADFAERFIAENPTGHEEITMCKSQVDAMRKMCKKERISVNDLLMARLYTAAKTNKIIIASDIRENLACYRKGAMGNYASAMGIQYKGKEKDNIKKAKEIHRLVKSHLGENKSLMLVLACYLNMEPTLIDAAAISALGGFQSKAASFVGGSMFGYKRRDGVSITNLGSIESETITEALFIPPASPATIQTVGAVTVNGIMRLCSSYYKQSVSKQSVRECLEEMLDVAVLNDMYEKRSLDKWRK